MLKYVEETPMELVVHYAPPEVVRALGNMASINGLPFDIT